MVLSVAICSITTASARELTTTHSGDTESLVVGIFASSDADEANLYGELKWYGSYVAWPLESPLESAHAGQDPLSSAPTPILRKAPPGKAVSKPKTPFDTTLPRAFEPCPSSSAGSCAGWAQPYEAGEAPHALPSSPHPNYAHTKTI